MRGFWSRLLGIVACGWGRSKSQYQGRSFDDESSGARSKTFENHSGCANFSHFLDQGSAERASNAKIFCRRILGCPVEEIPKPPWAR